MTQVEWQTPSLVVKGVLHILKGEQVTGERERESESDSVGQRAGKTNLQVL
jgi:hypothetical protein